MGMSIPEPKGMEWTTITIPNDPDFWRKVYKAAALQGMRANRNYVGSEDDIARHAALDADAMLTEDAEHETGAADG